MVIEEQRVQLCRNLTPKLNVFIFDHYGAIPGHSPKIEYNFYWLNKFHAPPEQTKTVIETQRAQFCLKFKFKLNSFVVDH